MAVRINVSDYDITRGVPEWNLTSIPYPRVNGTSGWMERDDAYGGEMSVEHTVLTADELEDVTGVPARRSGNTYAVAEITSGFVPYDPNDPYAYAVINQSPVAPVPREPYLTLRFSKWVYVKSNADLKWGFGYGGYDANYNSVGASGDTSEDSLPLNEWVRISFTTTTNWGSDVKFIGTALTITGPFETGDIVISTDYMETYDGLIDYFDGGFAQEGDTHYAWSDLPGQSASFRQTVKPSSVALFPPMNVIDYTVSEDAMSLDPADYSGGFGAITFDIDPDDDSVLLRGRTFELEDDIKGKTTGIVTGMTGTQDYISVQTDSMLGVLNSWNSIGPKETSLENYVREVFNIVGLTLPVQFQEGVGEIHVVSQGYVGNFWDLMKQLLSAYQVEMSLVQNAVTLRPLRTYEAYTGRASSTGFDLVQSETAKAVEVTYYNSVFGMQEFYPEKYGDPDYNPTIMQVGANEVVEYILDLPGSLEYVDQPVALNTMPNEPQESSVYSVTGNDDLPIRAAQWTDYGGKVELFINEDDPSKVTVKITGPNLPRLAPFRIAMSSGSGNYYNSLHICGIGTRVSPGTVRIPTGASTDTSGTDVGITVQNPFIRTRAQAYSVGVHTAAQFSGLTYTINGSAHDINRRNYTGGLYPSIGRFNEGWLPGSTVEDFNNRYSGLTLADFNAVWDEAVREEFAVQAFGNAAGARVRANDAYFRITSATFTPSEVQYIAELDTLIGDFNEAWSGATVSDFNEEFFNKYVKDFSTVPLRRNYG